MMILNGFIIKINFGRGTAMNSYDWERKEAEDKDRQNKNDERWNEDANNYNEKIVTPRNKFVENNPELAKKLGIEKLDIQETKNFNPLDHLKDEMLADLYRNTDSETLQIQKKVSEEFLRSPKYYEWQAKLSQQKKAEEEEKKQYYSKQDNFRKKENFWLVVSMLLGGVIGWYVFAFHIAAGDKAAIIAITAITFGIFLFVAEFDDSPFGAGCSGLIGGIIGAFILEAIHLHSILGIIDGAFVGALIGEIICKIVKKAKGI
jgi:hypothetical protein